MTGGEKRLGVLAGGVLLLAIVIALVLSLTACGGSSTTTGSTSGSGRTTVLRVVSTNTATTFDPSSSFSNEVAYMAQMYEPLIWGNPPGSPEPWKPALATSWQVSKDGLTWTFHLREGVKFHDGSSLTADAVKSSLDRTIKMGAGAAYMWADVKKIEAVDPLTVKFLLSSPTPMERLVSSEYGAWIFSEKAANKPSSWFDAPHDAGSGPYTITGLKPDQEVDFKRFDGYWGGWKPTQFKNVVVQLTTEATTVRQMLESGQVDLADGLSQEMAKVMQNENNVKIYHGDSNTSFVLNLNTLKKPLNDKLVRQAIAYATPYQDCITLAESGFAKQSIGAVPQGLWPSSPDLQQYTYNMAKAKQLLTQAGYPNGGFKLTLTYSSENDAERKSATLVKESLAKLGIDVTVRGMAWSQGWSMAKLPDPQKRQDMLLIEWWPSYPDGYDSLYTEFYTETKPLWNFSYFNNPTYNKLLVTAHKLSGTDVEKSQQTYNQAQTLLLDQSPAVFLFDNTAVEGASPAIKGVVINPSYPFVVPWYGLSI